ncbi:MAG: radical SAM protein [Candidatus Taylorbacteria bacterium]
MSLLFLEERFKPFLEELRNGTTIGRLRGLGNDTEATVTELIEQGLVVPTGSDDNIVLLEKQNTYLQKPSLETIFMLLTDSCNLRCGYCFINGNMPKRCPGSETMTWETAKEAVDMYFANLEPTRFQKTIVFYGGEPLLIFPLFQRIVEYIQIDHRMDYGRYEVGLVLLTNGTKITPLVAEYLAKHSEINVSISLDGCEKTHDQKRVYSDGGGTFRDVVAGIRMLHSAGQKEVSISATIDGHNIDRLDELLVLNEQFKFKTVNFNLLLDTADRVVDSAYTEKATKRMLEYFEKAREIGLYEDRIMRKVRAISNGVLHPFDCRATGGQLAISPDGSLGVCHEGVGCKTFFFGKVSKDLVFSDNPIIQEWGRRSPLSMPQCFNCPSLGLCGGGCAYSAHLRHGTIWAIDDKFCKHSLTVLEWLIWDVYSHI